jgi:hypothetical protein
MSGDHNMNQTGWRKRQIALDKKAENARELGLDYCLGIQNVAEPNIVFATGAKEVMRIDKNGVQINPDFPIDEAAQHVINALDAQIKTLIQAERNDERARCISHVYGQAGSDNVAERTVRAIRSGK